MKYYKVTAKCGHVSKGYYVDKDFPVKALSGSEASKKVMCYPRVKKHLKDKITSCVEIGRDEYHSLKKKNRKDGYFQSKNRRDQLIKCPKIYEEKKRLTLQVNVNFKPDYNYHRLKEKQIINIAKNVIKNELDIHVLNYNL
jgi:hypothetical protein